jgi:kynureninase
MSPSKIEVVNGAPLSPPKIGKIDFPAEADTAEYARQLDSLDPLRTFRDKFIIPSKANLKAKRLTKPGMSPNPTIADVSAQLTALPDSSSEPGIYLCGNSLGLQPRAVSQYLEAHLDTWSSIGVYGHFIAIEDSPLKPWQSLAEHAAEQSAKLVGALASEVAVMSSLTVNLHLLMASFYRPTGKKNKILLEWKAFPSDHVSSFFS